MATKPTQNPEWVTNDDPANIIEPTAPMKANGIVQEGIWGREHLNWMFNALGKWANWVRDYAMDKDNNLSEVDPAAARTNLQVPKAGNGLTEVSDNATNAALYVNGQEGTATNEFSNNLTNGQNFVAKTDIANNLTTESGTGGQVLDARQGKVLNDHFGTGGSQVQTNTQNDARFVHQSSRTPVVVWTGAGQVGVTDAEILAQSGHTVQQGVYILETRDSQIPDIDAGTVTLYHTIIVVDTTKLIFGPSFVVQFGTSTDLRSHFAVRDGVAASPEFYSANSTQGLSQSSLSQTNTYSITYIPF